ncbi:galactose-1-phosphate uridylyltransferase [Thermoproteota archaeon]
MPELRKDPILGRWVIISVERARRPNTVESTIGKASPSGNCPFCRGREDKTPPEVFAIRKSGYNPNASDWDVRVVPSNAPVFRIEGDIGRKEKGLYDVMNGIGAHEIIVESPTHSKQLADLDYEEIQRVLTCFIQRTKDLEGDLRFKYVLIFKNHGVAAGASEISHSRSQLIATPVTPRRVKEELIGARNYFFQNNRCIYCDIIRQETEAQNRVIHETKEFVVITPFASRFPFEIWIVPKNHSSDFYKISQLEQLALAQIMKIVFLKLRKGLDDPPFNMMLHTAPFRREKSGYWSTIDNDYHWHIEIIPRINNVAGFEWGTGFYICPISPEDAAIYLREVEI